MEKTLVILKPDCVARRLVGRVLERFEAKGLQISGLKMMKMDLPLARKMYAVHKGKDFYEPLVAFMTRGPIVVMCIRGKNAIAIVRKMLGPTFGPDAPPGTVRGDFGVSNRFNLVHASDSGASARRELALFFRRGEIVKGAPADFDWLYDTTVGTLV